MYITRPYIYMWTNIFLSNFETSNCVIMYYLFSRFENEWFPDVLTFQISREPS